MFSYIFVKELFIIDSKGKGAARYCVIIESRIESTKNILSWNGEKNYRPNINNVSNTEHVN